MQESNGTLYLVATPIGNLEDITFRAVRILKEADAVYCEDTRRTLVLLKHYNVERRNGIESFHDHSPPNVLQKIRKLLEDGASVAYVTDGGLPVVSDPGFVLVRAATQIGANVTVIPGPSAAATLFALSGLPSPKYFFHGFFPRTKGEVEKTIEQIRENPVVHLFYEAPGRISTSLEILQRNLPEHPAVLGRELTKIHEEVVRGTLGKIYEELTERGKIKGECVFAVLGGEPERAKAATGKGLHGVVTNPLETAEPGETIVIQLTSEQKDEVASLIKSGVSSKDAAKELSKKFKVPRRIIYEFIIRHLT